MVLSTVLDHRGIRVEVAQVGCDDLLEVIDITSSEEVVINDIEDM